LLALEDLGHLRKPIIGIYKPSSIIKNYRYNADISVIRTKSYSPVMLYLLNTKYLSCTTPMTSEAIGSYFLMRFSFFNPHAIHERKPWI
jgi:hypothetical protein